jgi:hypothetical protein
MALNATEVADLYPAFTEGEMSVGPVSQLTAPGMSSFYFARIFDDMPPGRYTIRTTINDAGSLWVGSQANSMRMIATFTLDPEITAWEYEFDLYEGDRRFDIYVHNLSLSPGPAGFIFGLYRNGKLVYASRAEHWRYETSGPVADADLSGALDTRRALPVFSVLPNWQNGIVERIEYLTDILNGERATEQRRSLRTIPRRSIEASFLRTGAIQDRLANFFTGMGTKPFLVPLWHEQYTLQFPLGPSSSVLAFPEGTLALREFRAGDVAIVFDKDPNVFDVVVIQGVDAPSDSMSVGLGLERTWHEGSRIIPLRKARLLDTPSIDNRTTDIGTMQLRFELLDGTVPFEPSWGYCSPLLRLEPNWQDNVVAGYERLVFELDNTLTTPFVVDPSDQTLVTQRAGFRLKGRAEVTALRSFIGAARGRAVRFYAPTYTDDVQPIGDIPAGQDHFDIYPSGLWETTQTRQFSRRTLGFFFKDDSPPFYRTVEAVAPMGLSGPPYSMTAERLYVDQHMPPIDMSRIKRISWMQAVRFDQDAFELHHLVDSSAVVRATLVFKGVDPTGMPPIDCGWVTSMPYPVDSLDAMTPSMVINGGQLYDPTIRSVDSYMGAMSINDGTLRPLLQSQTQPAEAYAPSLEVTSGTLQSLLSAYDNGVEALDLSATVTEGMLQTLLITYDRYPVEALDLTATITEGTLT